MFYGGEVGHKVPNEMCPIDGVDKEKKKNKCAYLAERHTSPAVSSPFYPTLSLPPFFFYGGNCSLSSHHWLKENFNTPLPQQELNTI